MNHFEYFLYHGEILGEFLTGNYHFVERSKESEKPRIQSTTGHCKQSSSSQSALSIRYLANREYSYLREDTGEGRYGVLFISLVTFSRSLVLGFLGFQLIVVIVEK